MSRALSKVQKSISKKRTNKTKGLHENSRDAQRLRSASAREEKISKLLSAAAKSNQIYVYRVAWFRDAIEGSTGPVSEDELRALTSSFIAREDDELDGLKAQRRPGRPTSIQEERIQQRIDAERREFRAGFWVPDLRTDECRLWVEEWSGNWAGLNPLKFVRVREGGGVAASSFPPKSLS